MLDLLLWVVGAFLLLALAIVIVIGIIKIVIRAAFSLLGLAALIWVILFLLNHRIV